MRHGDTVVYDILPTNLRSVHFYVVYGISAASFTLNAVLIALVITETHRQLRHYRRVLVLQCVADIFCTLVFLVTQMELEAWDGRMIFITHGPYKRASLRWQYAAVFFFIAAAHFSIFVAPLVFIFRYLLIVKDKTMSTRSTVVFLAVTAFTALHQGSLCVLLADKTVSGDAEACVQLMNYTIWLRDGVENCVITESLKTSPLMLYTVGFVSTHNAVAYAVMTYCAIGIARATTRSQVSARTARLHSQLNRMLIVQWCLPLVLSVLPLIFCLAVPLLADARVPGIGIVLSLLFSFVPLCSPVSTILFVGCFRRRCWRWCRAAAAAKSLAAKSIPGSTGSGAT